MKREMLASALVIFSVVGLAGCGSEKAEPVPIECRTQTGVNHYYSYQGAWSAKEEANTCQGTMYRALTSTERKAVKVAYPNTNFSTDPDLGKMSAQELYGMCAETDISSWSEHLVSPYARPVDVTKVKGMLILCPKHPLASDLKQMIS